MAVLLAAIGLLGSSCAARAGARAQAGDPTGWSEGEVHAGSARLPLTVVLEHDGPAWRGVVDVPTQYARQYPLGDVRIEAGAIDFRLPDLLPPGVFEGWIEPGRIRGRFESPLGENTVRRTFELSRRPAETPPYSISPVRITR